MKCSYCKREIPDESLFCMVCGEKVVREKRKKKEEKQIKVPMARQLKSGSWYIWLEKEGITEIEVWREDALVGWVKPGIGDYCKVYDVKSVNNNEEEGEL